MIDQDSKSIVEQDTVIPYILAGSTDKSIYLVRQDTGEIVDKYPIHQSPVLSISTYPPDPNYFVSTSMDGSTLLYHTLSKQILQKWNTHEKYVNKSLFSGDGEWFVTGSHDHSVNIYHRLQTQPLSYHFQQKLKFKGIIESLCFFNSESTLIVGIRNDHNLHYIHLPSMEETLVNMNANGDHWVSFSPMDLALSPNEKFLAVYTDSKAGRIIIYYNKTSNIVLNLWNTIVDEFSMPRLVWNPMGSLLCCTSNNDVYVFDIFNEGECVQKLVGHNGMVRSLAFTRDNELISGSFDQSVRIWELSEIVKS
ncbi:WD40-repeat-containing domain protein [Globomyces pollinis-pini]|nr:WD40-repeat-containing domain protein [Globomyces pollinis-pini]